MPSLANVIGQPSLTEYLNVNSFYDILNQKILAYGYLGDSDQEDKGSKSAP
jgi:hypothetical protein